MKIVICIKPIKSALLHPNESRGDELVMNPFDLYALEKTLKLKTYTDAKIIAISMGSYRTKELLQKALALGADEAILINDDRFRGSDTVATSYLLASAIKKIGNVDVVACGRQSADSGTGQVVYGLGERLDYYCLTSAEEIIDVEDFSLTIKQIKESEIIIGKLATPAVISFCDYVTKQPIVSLLALKKSRKKEIQVWNAEALEVDLNKCGLAGSKTQVVQIEKKMKKKQKTHIDGSAKEKAKFIYHMMTGKGRFD